MATAFAAAASDFPGRGPRETRPEYRNVRKKADDLVSRHGPSPLSEEYVMPTDEQEDQFVEEIHEQISNSSGAMSGMAGGADFLSGGAGGQNEAAIMRYGIYPIRRRLDDGILKGGGGARRRGKGGGSGAATGGAAAAASGGAASSGSSTATRQKLISSKVHSVLYSIGSREYGRDPDMNTSDIHTIYRREVQMYLYEHAVVPLVEATSRGTS